LSESKSKYCGCSRRRGKRIKTKATKRPVLIWSDLVTHFSFTAPFLVRVTMVVLRAVGLGAGHPDSFPHVILQVQVLKLFVVKVQSLLSTLCRKS